MRLVLVFLALAAVLAAPFLAGGDFFENIFGGGGSLAWLKSWGGWAWAAALGLLAADLLLPVPATAVLAALGLIYGPLLGGLVGAAGSCLSGALAYAACRLLGRPAARRLAGEAGLARAEAFFRDKGAWAVALSRWLPILPEALACLAGLARMPAGRFLAALACGSVPLAFACAALGAAGAGDPVLALAGAALLPLALWPAARRLIRARPNGGPATGNRQ